MDAPHEGGLKRVGAGFLKENPANSEGHAPVSAAPAFRLRMGISTWEVMALSKRLDVGLRNSQASEAAVVIEKSGATGEAAPIS